MIWQIHSINALFSFSFDQFTRLDDKMIPQVLLTSASAKLLEVEYCLLQVPFDFFISPTLY